VIDMAMLEIKNPDVFYDEPGEEKSEMNSNIFESSAKIFSANPHNIWI
jgi:hypothetical protein